MERATYARLAGMALLVSVVSVMVVHVGPGFIAGQRVTGTSDVAEIAARSAAAGEGGRAVGAD